MGLDLNPLQWILGPLVDAGAAAANYRAQMETNEMNYKLTKESWARDDSSMQRRVADLEAAGLNKVLAAGLSPMSSSAARMEAPTVDTNIGSRFLAAKAQAMQMAKTLADIKAASAMARENEANANIAERTDRLYRSMSDQLPFAGVDFQTNKLLAEITGKGLENQQREVDIGTGKVQLELLKKFGNAQGYMDLFSKGLDSVVSAVSPAKWFSPLKPKK